MNPLLSNYTFNTIPFSKITIENIEEAINKGIKEQNLYIQKIISNENIATFENTIIPFENSSSILEKATSLLFNFYSAKTNKEIDKLVDHVTPLLNAHSNNIIFNTQLFQRIRNVYNNASQQNFSTEDMMLLTKTYMSFKRNGALLTNIQKERLRKINLKLSQLSIKFSQNHLNDTNDFCLLITNENEIAGLPEIHRKIALNKAKEKHKIGWAFTLSAPSYIPFMKFVKNRDLRKHMYMSYNTLCTHNNDNNNLNIIKEIISLRLQKAKILGYDNYADYALEERMAKNVNSVYKLLDELFEKYYPTAINEVQEIKEEALLDDIYEIYPWDFAYYSHKNYLKKFNLNPEELRPFFELQRTKKGIFNLANKLYHINFIKNDMIETYHPDVEAYEVREANGTLLGTLFLDFFPRDNKQSGAWMTTYQDRKLNVLPIVSIVTNFTPATDSTPSLLSIDEVGTFLHEFGHALHGLFGYSSYASLSGTNVDRDFVELPSQFMENYLYEYDFLKTFAVHYKNNTPININDISKLKSSKNYNVAFSCIRQLFLGYLDLAYHTLSNEFSISPIKFEHEIMQKTLLLKEVENTCISSQFEHIMSGGYSAGYYSYKWAEVLDADAYSYFKEHGIFNDEIALKFRNKILDKGGTEDPNALYFNFRGKEPTIHALLQRDGII